jgi:hypothetical protein
MPENFSSALQVEIKSEFCKGHNVANTSMMQGYLVYLFDCLYRLLLSFYCLLFTISQTTGKVNGFDIRAKNSLHVLVFFVFFRY